MWIETPQHGIVNLAYAHRIYINPMSRMIEDEPGESYRHIEHWVRVMMCADGHDDYLIEKFSTLEAAQAKLHELLARLNTQIEDADSSQMSASSIPTPEV